MTLSKIGDVQLLFVSDGHKNWQPLLCTDLEMDPLQLMMAQSLWEYVEEVIIRSSDVLCYKIEVIFLFY